MYNLKSDCQTTGLVLSSLHPCDGLINECLYMIGTTYNATNDSLITPKGNIHRTTGHMKARYSIHTCNKRSTNNTLKKLQLPIFTKQDAQHNPHCLCHVHSDTRTHRKNLYFSLSVKNIVNHNTSVYSLKNTIKIPNSIKTCNQNRDKYGLSFWSH